MTNSVSGSLRTAGPGTPTGGSDAVKGPTPTGSILDRVFSVAAAPLCRAADASPDGVTVSLLYQGALADSTQIFIVRNAAEKPIGIVQLASAAAPGMVARGVARARIAAAGMGPVLGRAVLLPMNEGEIDGRSYAVMPYCLQFSHSRWRWGLERLRLRPVVLNWLHRITAETAVGAPQTDIDRRFLRPLVQLRAVDGASPGLVAGCDRAIERLSRGAWVPRHVLMHGDLWKGNVLLRAEPRGATARWVSRWSERLAVIDWAGAQPRGYPFFDLVRIAESLGVRARPLGVEVGRHCEALGCAPVDTPGYVLAAAGALLDDLGEFPLARLLGMAEASLARIDAAVATTRAGTLRPTA